MKSNEDRAVIANAQFDKFNEAHEDAKEIIVSIARHATRGCGLITTSSVHRSHLRKVERFPVLAHNAIHAAFVNKAIGVTLIAVNHDGTVVSETLLSRAH
jgi:hypothetical protein